MKHLHVMRHAKSSWDDPGIVDHDRPLNKRGRRDAPLMGKALSQRLATPVVSVSTATRAQETLLGLCEGWPELAERRHITEAELYTFSSSDVLDWLQCLDDGMESVFVIGHNPALTDLAGFLDPDSRIDNLPTAGYLELSLSVNHWADLQRGCARLDYSLFPRQLRS